MSTIAPVPIETDPTVPASGPAVAPPRPATRRRPHLGTEVAMVTGVFLLYKAVRYLVRDDMVLAHANASRVIEFERWIGTWFEPHLQSLVMQWQPLIEGLNWFYAKTHLVGTVAVMVLLYVVDGDTYRWLRRRLVGLTLVALVVHVVFPLAPPRLASSTDMVDSLVRFGPAIYSEGSALSRLANPYAAMPSLHFGYAVLIAWALVRSAGRGRFRHGLWAHPVVMLVAIIATANHYWVDAAVCGLLIVAVDVAARRAETQSATAELPSHP